MPLLDTTTFLEAVHVFHVGRDEPEGVATRQTSRGPRYVCPACYRKARTLYRVEHRGRSRRQAKKPLRAHPDDLACRRCHALRYRVQYDTAEDRRLGRLLGVPGSAVRALARRWEEEEREARRW